MTEKRSAIRQATLDLVAERGLHNTPTSLIARVAGVAEGTIFVHFSTKDQLLEEVFTWRLQVLRTAIARDLGKETDLYLQFISIGENLLDFYLAEPATYFYIENYLGSALGRSFRHDFFFNESFDEQAPLINLLQQGVKNGQVKPLPRFALSALVIGPLYFYFEEIFCQEQKPDRNVFRAILDCSWQAIAQG